jgi:hypothetical protein
MDWYSHRYITILRFKTSIALYLVSRFILFWSYVFSFRRALSVAVPYPYIINVKCYPCRAAAIHSGKRLHTCINRSSLNVYIKLPQGISENSGRHPCRDITVTISIYTILYSITAFKQTSEIVGLSWEILQGQYPSCLTIGWSLSNGTLLQRSNKLDSGSMP